MPLLAAMAGGGPFAPSPSGRLVVSPPLSYEDGNMCTHLLGHLLNSVALGGGGLRKLSLPACSEIKINESISTLNNSLLSN